MDYISTNIPGSEVRICDFQQKSILPKDSLRNRILQQTERATEDNEMHSFDMLSYVKFLTFSTQSKLEKVKKNYQGEQGATVASQYEHAVVEIVDGVNSSDDEGKKYAGKNSKHSITSIVNVDGTAETVIPQESHSDEEAYVLVEISTDDFSENEKKKRPTSKKNRNFRSTHTQVILVSPRENNGQDSINIKKSRSNNNDTKSVSTDKYSNDLNESAIIGANIDVSTLEVPYDPGEYELVEIIDEDTDKKDQASTSKYRNTECEIFKNKVRKQYECRRCLKMFFNWDNYKRHVEMHDQRICNICGKILKSEVSLREHILIQHTDGEFVYTCHICGKEYKHVRYLKTHIKGVHKWTLKCDICSKKFSTRPRIARHMVVHSRLKDFPCNVCGRAFSQKTTADHHCENSRKKGQHIYLRNVSQRREIGTNGFAAVSSYETPKWIHWSK